MAAKRSAGDNLGSHCARSELRVASVLMTPRSSNAAGELFDLGQRRAHRWIQRLLPVFQQALKDLGVRPERNPPRFARHERKQAESLDLIMDGAARPRQRKRRLRRL